MFAKINFFIKNLSEKQIILVLFFICFALRLYAVLMAQGIANDSAAYGFMARYFMKGHFEKALSIPGHPLYPLLISLLSPNTSHVEIVGRLISLFFGTITFFIIYYLIKKEIGQKEALLTLLFYTFHPYLSTYSGMMLTEAMYWGLLVISIYFYWTGLKGENIWRMIPAGTLLGLSYLTRPEGIGYLLIYLIWIVIISMRNRIFLKGIFQIVFIFVFTFIVASPYILYIHRETGQWLITKKALGFQSLLLNREITDELKKDKTPELTKKNNLSDISYDSPKVNKKDNPEIKNSKWILITKNIINYFPYVIYHYLRAFHYSLWIFLFFGIIRFRNKVNFYEFFITSIIFFHIISLATFIPSTIRFSVPLIPLSLFLASSGVMEMKRFLGRIKTIKEKNIIFALIFLLILVQLPQTLKPERKHRAYQKEVGLWLKRNTPRDAIIMSNSPQEAFYADREFVMFPKETQSQNPLKSYQEVIQFSMINKVRYILIDKNIQELNRGFIELINSINSEKLKELKEIYRKSDQKLVIYEVIY